MMNYKKRYLLIEYVVRMVPFISHNFAEPTENGVPARTQRFQT